MTGGKIYEDILNLKNYKANSKYNNNFFYNGRFAFYSILNEIKKRKINKIYLPNYICSSLIESIPKSFQIFFYEINNKLEIVNIKCKDSVILIIDFFGKRTVIDKSILKNNCIIYDKTFTFNYRYFNLKKNFFFSSPRKIFPSMICSIANIKNKNPKILNNKLLQLYKESILGSNLRNSYNNSKYYSKSKIIEDFFIKKIYGLEDFFNKNFNNYKVENFFKNYFLSTSFDKKYLALKKNKQLTNYYIRKIKNIKILDDKNILFSLFLTKKKNKLVRYLRKNSIYISNYWTKPNLLKNKTLSHNLYEKLILLPNDFNLKESEIKKMSKIINNFFVRN